MQLKTQISKVQCPNDDFFVLPTWKACHCLCLHDVGNREVGLYSGDGRITRYVHDVKTRAFYQYDDVILRVVGQNQQLGQSRQGGLLKAQFPLNRHEDRSMPRHFFH